MESVHIGELYCKVCRRVVGIEYKTAANGKKERRCLSRLCRGEAEKGASAG